jgi:tRNA(Phe) wybutosine-synthesizing methylase Tyw3
VSHAFVKEAKVISAAIEQDVKENADVEGRSLWVKLEPVIVAVCCRDIDTAVRLLNLARACGLKNSCIRSIAQNKVMACLVDSHRIETLVATSGQVLVNPLFMQKTIEAANHKLLVSRQRLERLRLLIQRKLYPLPTENT